MVALTAPEMEFFPQVTASLVNRTKPYRGHDGMRRYFEDAERVWVRLEIIPHEYHDLGDRVLVFGRVYARGEGGYISDSPAAWLWRVKGGLISWGRVFTSRAEALEAALAAYPEARVDVDNKAVTLRPARPPIARVG